MPVTGWEIIVRSEASAGEGTVKHDMFTVDKNAVQCAPCLHKIQGKYECTHFKVFNTDNKIT